MMRPLVMVTALALAWSCAPLSVRDLPPPCQQSYADCLNTCPKEEAPLPRDVTANRDDRDLQIEQATCVERCNDEAESCAGKVGARSGVRPQGDALTPAAHPGQWIAEYFPTTNFADLCLSRVEATVEAANNPCPDTPSAYSARWRMLSDRPAGQYQLRARTRGRLTLRVGSTDVALEAGGDGELRSAPFALSPGQVMVLDYQATPSAPGVRVELVAAD